MKEERIEILRMLKDGLISVEEAEKLLAALNTGENKSREKDNYSRQSFKHNRNFCDPDFPGSNFFKDLDKGFSKFGKVMGDIFGNSEGSHPFKMKNGRYDDFESFQIINNRIIPQEGDRLEICQEVNAPFNSSCDINLVPSGENYISIDAENENSFEILKKKNILVILCYDDCEISLPDGLIDLTINLINGDMEISGINSPISLETLNGDIEIRNCLKPYFVKSLSGDIEMTIDKSHSGKCEITSLSGDVKLQIPEKFSGIVEAKAISGEIYFYMKDNVTIKKDQKFIQEQLTAIVNGGTETNLLCCSTLSGDIEIDSYTTNKEA